MKIKVVTSTGKGRTSISAFDKALKRAGISNMNLICLSSIIPPNSQIVFEKPSIEEKDYGKRLYLVMARNDTSKNGKIAAGIGWVLEKNNRFGLFVEHEGASYKEVEDLIRKSLEDMVLDRSGYDFSDIQYAISEEDNVEGEVSCALAAAVYDWEDWNEKKY